MFRTIVGFAIAAALASSALAQDRVRLRVMGLPLATGKIQQAVEQPFFESFASRTGLPIDFDYKPLDSTGVKEFEQLRVMRSGIYDVVTLRLGQVSRDEPTILGLDLVGMNTDYKTARANVAAFLPVLDKQMQAQHNLVMLGVWPFGPQIIFCKAPVTNGLSDLKGKKIRVLDGVMARFMEKVGATPVTMAFSEVAQGLRLGTIDCGVTGPSSANSAGWMDSATHVYSLGLQVAVQGYAISVASWKKLSPSQQAGLKAQFAALTENAWAKSEELWSDGIRCSTGQTPCTDHKPFKAVLVQPSARDIEIVKTAVRDISLPAWAEVCDKANPGCSTAWKSSVGALMGIQ